MGEGAHAMAIWQAVVLGIVQGATEFLPVSSSGHLVLARVLLHVSPPGAALEAALHGGTLLSVIWYYRRPLFRAVEHVNDRSDLGRNARHRLISVALASLPAAFVALVFRTALEGQFARPLTAAFGFLATAAVIASLGFCRSGRTAWPSVGGALLIGVIQAFALVPGLSRSGATTVAGRWLGLTDKASAQFSFILSVPAVAGAMVLEMPHLVRLTGHEALALAIGAGVAAVVGTLAIAAFVRSLRTGSVFFFGLYTGVLGTLTLYLLGVRQ